MLIREIDPMLIALDVLLDNFYMCMDQKNEDIISTT